MQTTCSGVKENHERNSLRSENGGVKVASIQGVRTDLQEVFEIQPGRRYIEILLIVIE
jgi:hypothetical protein